MKSISLSSLDGGNSGRVTKLSVDERMRRRLLDLGLTCGTKVTCLRRGLGGEISAYSIRGAVIAIRRSDADNIFIN